MRDTRAMVVPENIVDAAESGDVITVRAWLDADSAHNVNDTDPEGSGLLTVAGSCVDVTRGAALIAFLLARGADVNQRRGETRLTTLHLVCLGASPGAVEHLLLHGADVNALLADENLPPHSPLSVAAGSLDYRITENELAADTDMDRLRYKAESTHRTVIAFCRDTHACIVLLLRAGAALDGQAAGGTRPEVILERRIGDIPPPEHPDCLPKMELKRSRDLLAAVRAAGGWRKWTLVPPKKLLRLRSLIARGRARAPRHITPSHRREVCTALAWLMSPNVPNEIAWRMLAFWNPRH